MEIGAETLTKEGETGLTVDMAGRTRRKVTNKAEMGAEMLTEEGAKGVIMNIASRTLQSHIFLNLSPCYHALFITLSYKFLGFQRVDS